MGWLRDQGATPRQTVGTAPAPLVPLSDLPSVSGALPESLPLDLDAFDVTHDPFGSVGVETRISTCSS